MVFNYIPGTRDQAQYVVLCVCESVSQPVTLSQYLMLLEGNEENESCAQSQETRQRVICCNIMRWEEDVEQLRGNYNCMYRIDVPSPNIGLNGIF